MPKTNINLLPSQLAPKVSVVRFVRVLKKGIMVGLVVYLLCAVASIVAFFLISNQLKTSVSKEDEVKKSIKALEETEQKLIFIQDRLGKIEAVYGKTTAKEEVEHFGKFVNELPEGVAFGKADLSSDKITISLSALNSESLAILFSNLYANEKYNQVILTSYSYSEKSGYSVGLVLSI